MKTTVEIPVEEYEALKALAGTVAELQQGFETATATIAHLKEQLAWFSGRCSARSRSA